MSGHACRASHHRWARASIVICTGARGPLAEPIALQGERGLALGGLTGKTAYG